MGFPEGYVAVPGWYLSYFGLDDTVPYEALF
jgi:hypothetical protein